MFKWRRRRPKGNQTDRDLEEAARVLEDAADFGDYLGIYGRRSGSTGAEGNGDPDRGVSLDPSDAGPDPSPGDDSDQGSAS